MFIKLVQIGNSKGVRLPKTILKQYNLLSEIEMDFQKEGVLLKAPKTKRWGWKEAFQEMAHRGDDALLNSERATSWDQNEWQW